MIKWIKSLLGKRKAGEYSAASTQDSDLLEQFEVFLGDRMKKLYPDVREAFAILLGADFPDSIKGLHIEVFLDDPGFSFRLFSTGKIDVWEDEPEPVTQFNDTIDSLWPIVTEDEMDQYLIWEDGPKWERQAALEQPVDKLNVHRIALPWFKKIVSETRGNFPHPITASIHDLTPPEEL